MRQNCRQIPFSIAPRSVLAISMVLAGAAAHAADPVVPPPKPTYHERLLERHGITPDVKGLSEYLRKLRPAEAQRRYARELVVQLGSKVFSERESASRELSALPRLPLEALKRAAAGEDAEVRWRARKLLDTRETSRAPLLFAVFKTIVDRNVSGLTAGVIKAIPLCESPYLRRIARQAAVASATMNDVPLLRTALNDPHVEVQAAAVAALAVLLKAGARNELRTLLESPKRDDIVVLAAARELANIGDRTALASLIRLLSSDNVAVRSQAAVVLRGSTNRNFGFASYASPADRGKTIARWQTWLGGAGKTAKLQVPLKVAALDQSYLYGNTLLACGYKNKVIEFNPEWKPVWEFTAQGAFGAQKLANGNVLIACYGPNEVIEVSPTKKVVWRMKLKSCINARRLPNGNILIAGHTSKVVLEVSRDQKTVWQYKSKWNCYDAHRLPNGNTLVSSERGVEEITPDGKVAWQHMPGQSCYGVQPLPNGHVLLANYSKGEVAEITRAGATVWRFKIGSPFDAFRLPNGNTLVTTNRQYMEVTPAGKTLWKRTGNTHGRTRR